MTKYKVSELEGALLDAAVAIAEGFEIGCSRDGSRWATTFGQGGAGQEFVGYIGVPPTHVPVYSPSRLWMQGGPILDRELISLYRVRPVDEYGITGNYWCWSALKHLGMKPWLASSALTAAMRCYVADKFGEEVELP